MMNRKGMQEMGPKKRKLYSLLGWLHAALKEEWEFEQQLPKDYERIMKMIENPESQIITKKDLYSLLSIGTRLNNGEVWLSLSKDGKVNEMISATTFSYENCWSSELKVLENSRFGTVAEISDTSRLNIPINIKTQFLSLGIIYGAYLVFKFCDTTTVSSEPYVKLEYSIANKDLNSYVAERRDDGWIMIELCRFRNHNQITELKVQLERFGTVAEISDTSCLNIPINIKTRFLSLGIIYGAYLVFKFCDPKTVSSEPYVKLEYSIASEDLNSYVAERRVDGWMMIELCRFRNHNQIAEFNVQLERFRGHPCGNGPIFVDGIEFRPIDNLIIANQSSLQERCIKIFYVKLWLKEAQVEHEESVDRSINNEPNRSLTNWRVWRDFRKIMKCVGRLMNAKSSVNRDQQSPSELQEIMKRSQYDVINMTKQELDKLLSTGVLIDNGEKLFSLCKVNCKKCHMLPAKAVIPDAKFTKCPSSTMSRFEEVVELPRQPEFSIKCNIETQMLSPDTAYACYLLFKLPEIYMGLKCPVEGRDLLKKSNKESSIIYLIAPGPVELYRDKRVPDRREDGWMEVRVWEFVYNNEIKDNYIPMELKLACLGGTMSGLIICGVEFRPL
ncbi:phloem protein 2-like protein [Tanacetum coccineum]